MEIQRLSWQIAGKMVFKEEVSAKPVIQNADYVQILLINAYSVVKATGS